MKVVLIFNWWNADQWPIDLDDGHETWLMLCDANNNALETGWTTKNTENENRIFLLCLSARHSKQVNKKDEKWRIIKQMS